MLALWGGIALSGVLADLHTGALAGVWIAAAAVAAALAGALGLPPPLAALVFVGAAVAFLALLRPAVRRFMVRPAPEPATLLGKLGSALDQIDDGLASGRVVIEGVAYVARLGAGSPPLPAGAPVRVRAVEAGDVIVEAL
jgi:membrane protein implicated in regulation of membrane protease activity